MSVALDYGTCLTVYGVNDNNFRYLAAIVYNKRSSGHYHLRHGVRAAAAATLSVAYDCPQQLLHWVRAVTLVACSLASNLPFVV